MDLITLQLNARERFKGSCRVCRVCNGIACAGEVPGMGGRGTGSSFCNNVAALAKFRLQLHTVHCMTNPNLSCSILGMNLSLPIIGAPIAGIGVNMKGALSEEDYALAIVEGCCLAGTVAMTGDGSFPEQFESGLSALKNVNGHGIPIIKPRANDKIIDMANRAAEAGAPAFGIDIDAAGFLDMAKMGHPVGPKTQEELAFIKKKLPIPFIVKGIMSSTDALACLNAGVDAIVVSNHGGRALDRLSGTADALPAIAKVVKGKLALLVDGGVRSGVDVLTMLALGADAVLIGRPLAIGAVGGFSQGVELLLKNFAAELQAAMVLTGTSDVSSVSGEIISREI